MIKKIMLFMSIALSSLITANTAHDILEQYDLKDIGTMYCKSQNQSSEHLSDEQLIALGKQYLDSKKNLEKYVQQHSSLYNEWGQSALNKIKSCQERWFKSRRESCLEVARNTLSSTIVPKTEQEPKNKALKEYTAALEQEQQSSAIF